MKGANKAFLDQKDRWLLNNLLVYQVMTPPTGSPNNVYSFDLWRIGTIQDGAGTAKTMYELHQINERLIKDKADRSSNHIRAYFLPWTTGQTKSMQLGTDADFFFTPTLTGCTFAAASGQNPTVAHSNYVTGTGTVDQTTIDNDLNTLYGAAPIRKVEKTQYKTGTNASDFLATVVGFRTSAGWNFYYQRYRRTLAPKVGGGSQVVTVLQDRAVLIA